MDKFDALFNNYNCNLIENTIDVEVEKLIKEKKTENLTVEIYKECLSFIDLTSLNTTDTNEGIESLVEKVNGFSEQFDQLPNIAAVCVYPSMISTVKSILTENVEIASVTGGFPSAQTFIEIKVAETAMAIMEGATEIDVVMPVGKFLENDFQTVYEELSEIKAACKNAKLKVILETSLLPSYNSIKKATVLAMASGADFIKTSSGKTNITTTLGASLVICTTIKEWNEQNSLQVGFKVSGGITTPDDAVKHYTIVKNILGKDWLTKQYFRIGASKLANNLLSSITGTRIDYF